MVISESSWVGIDAASNSLAGGNLSLFGAIGLILAFAVSPLFPGHFTRRKVVVGRVSLVSRRCPFRL